jgi:hypothetical protein
MDILIEFREIFFFDEEKIAADSTDFLKILLV